jgi:hypothetical protein
MRVNLDGQQTHYIVVQAHQSLHFLDRVAWGVGFQKGLVALTIFVDFIGHRFDTPLFTFNNFSSIICKNG